MNKLALLVVFVCLSTCNATDSFEELSHIQLLRPRPADVHRKGVNCLSWRLAVETHNIRDWKLVPASCESYVGKYMLGKQYRNDCETVADAAIEYAKSYKIVGDGKDAWVFDIDETTLSNMPYYARSDVQFGFADSVDKWLIFFGILSSIGEGLTAPMSMLVLSGAIDAFGSAGQSIGAEVVNRYVIRLLYVAVGVGIASFFDGLCWTRTAERQTSRIRMEYLRQVGFFDKDTTSTMFQVISNISSDAHSIQDVIADNHRTMKFVEILEEQP